MSQPTLNPEQIIAAPYISFGTDPELFLEKSGQIIGSEKVIPKDGIPTYPKDDFYAYYHDKPNVVLDGVQIELHPASSGCRAAVGWSMRLAFTNVKKQLEEKGGDVKASFTAVVDVPKEELDSLSEDSKKLGCMPSLNIYDTHATINVDPATYLVRSAGGHLHFGIEPEIQAQHKRIVPIMDIIIGNTAVLLDRDPRAAERRQNYGRAGEYRLPSYGIEYRTLSNFWLRSYQLMSMMMGLGRLAIGVIWTTDFAPEINEKDDREARFGRYKRHAAIRWNAEADLLKRVDIEKIREAINTNNLELARENYKGVRDFIAEHVPENDGDYDCTALDCGKLDLFDYFLKKVDEGGLEYWFPNDPMTHWTNLEEGHDTGWEAFLNGYRSTDASTFGGKNESAASRLRYTHWIEDNVKSRMERELNGGK